MSTLPTVAIWRVRPLHTPALLRRCARCDEVRPFASSDRFRVNAQGRRLDVWLIYRCLHCEQTWNRPVLERVRPEDIPEDRYNAYLGNDRETAWDVAFQPGAGSIAPVEDFAVDVSHASGRVRLSMPWPVPVRLDRVLARGLGWSRSQVKKATKIGHIYLEGDASLSSAAKDGMTVILRAVG